MKNLHYARIEKAIRYLEEHSHEQPSLDELAKVVQLSPFHFQRLFQQWAGTTPKKFLQYLTIGDAKKRLKECQSILDATYGSGLSGPGRLHDLFLSVEAMTPGEYKSGGRGLEIEHSVLSTPFGEALASSTTRGICGFSFLTGKGEKGAIHDLRENWPEAKFSRRVGRTLKVLRDHFNHRTKRKTSIGILLKGTPFQLKVWEALLRIPEGFILAYKDVAGMIGEAKASRAVGTAIGQNPIAYLIPCHRVIRETGVLGDYRWGPRRKKAILSWEAHKNRTLSQDRISMNSVKESTIQSGSAALRISRVP